MSQARRTRHFARIASPCFALCQALYHFMSQAKRTRHFARIASPCFALCQALYEPSGANAAFCAKRETSALELRKMPCSPRLAHKGPGEARNKGSRFAQNAAFASLGS